MQFRSNGPAETSDDPSIGVCRRPYRVRRKVRRSRTHLKPASAPLGYKSIRLWCASEGQFWDRFDESSARGTFVALPEMCEWEPSKPACGRLAQFPDWWRDLDRPRIPGPALTT
jgi:hypothetical protein